jgi:CBS domain-containing protein
METTKIKDLMLSLKEYVTISEDATVFEAVLALEEARKKTVESVVPHRAILVCDKNNKVIGKLSQLDVLRSLEPKYGTISELKGVSGFGLGADYVRSMMDTYDLWKAPLVDLCRKAADVKVGSVVRAPLEHELIDQEATLNRAVHELIVGHHQSLLVTAQGEIVGILRLADVYQAVTDRMKACRL